MFIYKYDVTVKLNASSITHVMLRRQRKELNYLKSCKSNKTLRGTVILMNQFFKFINVMFTFILMPMLILVKRQLAWAKQVSKAWQAVGGSFDISFKWAAYKLNHAVGSSWIKCILHDNTESLQLHKRLILTILLSSLTIL